MSVHEVAWGATREWFTPASLFDALGVTFDLDPASPMSGPVPWVPATRFYSPSDNGLVMPWSGHVWLNPPYGPPAVAFTDRMIAHGDGILLLPSRTETRVYQRALAAAECVCFLRDRLWFIRADGVTGRSSFGSTLFAFGLWAALVLHRAGLGWITPAAGKAAPVEPRYERLVLRGRQSEIVTVPDFGDVEMRAGRAPQTTERWP